MKYDMFEITFPIVIVILFSIFIGDFFIYRNFERLRDECILKETFQDFSNMENLVKYCKVKARYENETNKT